MHNLRHFYYQNKEKIWKVVLIIAFILGLIYFLDSRAIEKNNKNLETSNNNEEIYSNEEDKTYISEKSPMSGGTVTEQEAERINSTITKFLKYCKEESYEQAYNMLSADCKQNHYNTLEQFQTKYIKSKFNKDDVYEIEKWIGNTYKISISKDLLATGDVNNNPKKVEYITIVKENSEEKLNINGYVGSREINKSQTQNNVKITVISKKTYMDYETYELKIENFSNKTIKVDSLEGTETIYLEDASGNHYNAYMHEIFEDDLEIRSKHKNTINIKFANSYSARTSIRKVVFENILLDYVKYKTTENKEEFNDICEVAIDL